MTWKPLFPHRNKLSVRLNRRPPVEGLYQPCAIPLSQLMVHCLLFLNGLPAHSCQRLSPSSPNSPREQLLVLCVVMVVFAQLHQLTKKNFTSEISLSYTFQGKCVLLVNDSSGPTLSLQKVPRWGEVMQDSMLNIWRKHSDPSEVGVPKLRTVKQSELAPCTFVLEEMISTEACPWQCKVDGFYDWPLDWWWRKYQKRQIWQKTNCNLWHQTPLTFLRNSLKSGKMGGERGLLSLSQLPKAALSTAGPSSTSPVESGKMFPVRTHTVPSNLWELAVLRRGEASLLPQGRGGSAVSLTLTVQDAESAKRETLQNIFSPSPQKAHRFQLEGSHLSCCLNHLRRQW